MNKFMLAGLAGLLLVLSPLPANAQRTWTRGPYHGVHLYSPYAFRHYPFRYYAYHPSLFYYNNPNYVGFRSLTPLQSFNRWPSYIYSTGQTSFFSPPPAIQPYFSPATAPYLAPNLYGSLYSPNYYWPTPILPYVGPTYLPSYPAQTIQYSRITTTPEVQTIRAPSQPFTSSRVQTIRVPDEFLNTSTTKTIRVPSDNKK